MQNLLIFHGWMCKPEEHWYNWLKIQSEIKGYKVLIPEIPTFDREKPSLKISMNSIVNSSLLNISSVLVGHSLGSLLGLRIAEKYKFNKLILVSGWDFDDLTPAHELFWLNKINHSRIKKNVRNIYILLVLIMINI